MGVGAQGSVGVGEGRLVGVRLRRLVAVGVSFQFGGSHGVWHQSTRGCETRPLCNLSIFFHLKKIL